MEGVKRGEATIKEIRNRLKSLIGDLIQELYGSPTHLEKEINKETMLFLEFEYRNSHKEPVLIDVVVVKDSPKREYELSNLAAYFRHIVEKELRLLNAERHRENKEIKYQKEYESVIGKYAYC